MSFREEIQNRLYQIRTNLKPEIVPIYFRPFVCNGDPYQCTVMFVGFNSANSMPRDWDDYWSDCYGYLYNNWREDYTVSKSRRMIERIIAEAGNSAEPIHYITTNLYSIPTRGKSGLPGRYQNEEMRLVFSFLVEELRESVRVIVPFGIDAVRWFEALDANSVEKAKVVWPYRNDDEKKVCHFGLGFSEERARDLGNRIRDRLECLL